MELLRAWFKRTFSDPQVVILGVFLLFFVIVVFGLGAYLAPVFVSLVIAYLLEAAVYRLEKIRMPRLPAVIIVFLFFLATLIFLLFVLVPMLTSQLSALVQQFPNYINQGLALLEQLPERYPQMVNEEQIERITRSVGSELAGLGQSLVSWSLASVASAVGLLIFLVLVPVLVFFFLKDKQKLIQWFVNYLPNERGLVTSVWVEVEGQIANYVRGKAGEIVIVGAVSYVTFVALGLQYAALLATLVGFSVLIPYVGAAVVTLPIALVGFFQWGWGWDFGQIMIAYAIIQALDGNVLVPLMFSEAVNLHPVAIIVAILVFGGLWGFWGVFFAIPLATVVQAVLKAWPRAGATGNEQAAEPGAAEAS
ncbi:MAG: AI-2E family transporter [Xanthomonadales bacterium]|nr:AI-2E family transporter [Gammaproteobacteria bacterium]NNE05471.1 AI-2E family transporter [Xanthomonadales bacterium]NNL95569.1 AI-2E family transporter [Xanthomonadales bacterium]